MTRYQRFIQRRERYLRRARRQRTSGWVTRLLPSGHGTFYWRRMSRKYLPDSGGPQTRPIMAIGQVKLNPNTFPAGHLLHWTATKPGKGVPPVVAFDGPFKAFLDAFPWWHQRYAVILYRRRKVQYRGRKSARMRGLQRQLWGAAFQAYNNGYFPLWDPAGRHPDENDQANGDPPYSGPFPQTPR